ncbi:MAG: LLM class F420-dependent oxidoreductase [Deltaproteobacteria bacterium]|nr:LLM class F420-dependent oxidoreductase [Deltaproteobacteria bacterium]MBI3386456.1 LLM class F420-dependent oxidoreductase [Deltaproteobacteria bacterium]
MRFGLNAGYSGARMALNMEMIHEADRLGFHSVWTAEAYGSDAVTPATWIAAQTKQIKVGTGIMQMPARTPAMTAMTATTLDQLSGGRFLLGLGVSGPQVVEGWHGVPYGKPLKRTREYIEILRAIWAREKPVEHSGEHYQIPYRGAGASGLGKPLKSILRGRQIPIYVAATGLKSVEQVAEIADGWLPIFYSPYRAEKVYGDALQAGFKKAGGGKNLQTFDIAAGPTVILGDDVAACLNFIKPILALYIGGMGARGKNFYNDLACRYGFEAAAKTIQDLYLDGKKNEATAAVPDALADEVSLVGPKERIRDRLAAWSESSVTTMICATMQVETLRVLAEAQ